MTTEADNAHNSTSADQPFGPLPEQAGWAVAMYGELVLFANNAEKASGRSPGAKDPVFTADQMRAYAAQAVAAERERHACKTM